MQVEASATPLLTVDEVEKTNKKRFSVYSPVCSSLLMLRCLTDSFKERNWMAVMDVLFNTRAKENIMCDDG